MRFAKIIVPVLFLAALLACSKPPQVEVDAAKTAVDAAAQNADVTAYAPSALQAARDKLAQLQSELDAQAARGALSRRYDAAKNLALETKAAADSLAVEAASAKAQAKSDAASLIDELKKTALPEAEKGLAMARNVRGVKLDFKALSASLAQAKTEVAAAEKAWTSGDYATARATAEAVKGSIAQGSQAVADAIAAAKVSK